MRHVSAFSPLQSNIHIQSLHEKTKYSSNQCDHQATGKGNLKKHINILIWGSEDSYSEKFKYSCNQCDHQATGNKYCNKRERERGTGVLTLYYFYSSPDTIQCSLSLSLCETTALSQWERTHHLKSDPEGIRYPCSSCKYKSRNKGKLNSHIQVKHKGGRRSPAVSVNTRPASLKKYSHRSSKLFQGRLSPPLD